MITTMHKIVDACILDRTVRIILVTGGSKSFCAGTTIFTMPYIHACVGGDLKHFISEGGGWNLSHVEYLLDRKISKLPFPYLSILDGVVMGGGVGISVHGRYRVVTDKTIWAMPEVCFRCKLLYSLL